MTTPIESHTSIEKQRQKWYQRLRQVSRFTWMFFILAIALNAASWILVYVLVPPTDSVVYLHSTIYFGIDLTGDWWKLLVTPITGSVLLLVNWIPFFLRKDENGEFIMKSIMMYTTMLEALILVATYFIVLLNVNL